MNGLRWTASALALFAVVGCGGSEKSSANAVHSRGGADGGTVAPCVAGGERCACRADGTCGTGLRCGSGLCVNVGGGGGASSGGNGGTTSGGAGGVTGAGGNPAATGGKGGTLASGGARALDGSVGPDGALDASSSGTGGVDGDSSAAAGGTAGSGGATLTGGTTSTGGRSDSGALLPDGGKRKPIALFIIVDRSGSMVTGFPTGSAQSWTDATAALSDFVADPQSQGLDVGLAFFPPTDNSAGMCDGSDCGVPVVDIGPILQTAGLLTAAMTANPPSPLNQTPTECALRGMINRCLAYTALTGEQCVAVLVTDGNPTLCDTSTANLVGIVADGKSQGVETFALGLAGSDLTFLNAIAAAGGTDCIPGAGYEACDVSGGSAAFVAALDVIRQQVP